MKTDKLLGALGLCRRAGALLVGFDAVAGALESGEAVLVMLAVDLSPRTTEKVRYLCGEELIPETLPLTQDEIAQITRKAAGVLAVTNPNLAVLCRKTLSACNTEKEETT